jgi:hypothetical protein
MAEKAATVYTSLPGVIVKSSANGLGTHTICLDITEPALGQVSTVPQESSAIPNPTIEPNNLFKAAVSASKRHVILRDSHSPTPSNNGSSASSGLTLSEKARA